MSQPTSYPDHYRKLITLGVPIIIGQIGMIILGFADTIMIGHHSTEELGAASFVNNLFNLVIIGSTGFSYGLTPVIGQLFGHNDRSAIGGKLKNALLANFIVALVFILGMTVLFFNIDNLNQPAELIPLIKPYYLVLLGSLIFILLFNAFKQFADGIMDTRTSMWILLIGNLIHIVLNYALIYGAAGLPELGLFGAGISTLFSRFLMMAIFIGIFLYLPRYREYRQGFFCSHFNRADFRQLNAMGWPLALQMGMETASFSLTTIMVGWISTIALAAHQVMLTISTIFFMMYYGMGAATAIRVAYYKGQENLPDLRRAAFSGFHLIMVMAVIATGIFWQFRHSIGTLFTDNTLVTATVVSLFIPMMIYQFGDALQIAFANSLRGISDVKIMMVFSFIAYFVISLSASYVFGFVLGYGIVGIWMAFPFGLTSAGIMFWLRFLCKTRKPLAK